MQKKWLIKNIKYDYKRLSQELGMPEEISRCIINRCPGTLDEIKDYLNPSLESLHDPSLMKDMDLAVELIMEAIDSEEHIRLMGDFDIDGSMSIYVVYMALKKLGAIVSYDIPDRVTEGYGLNEAMVEKAAEDGVGLIITLDNGISAFDGVNYAKELGLMVIVTDHHDVPFIIEDGARVETIPLADAVINPKREECNYPFKMLCGAGVAFKLITQLYQEMGVDESELWELLPFVAIATVGDIMDLTGENRVIVKHGLELVKKTKNQGLRALAELSKVDLNDLSTYAIGFIIGPCFNAAGRLDTAKKTVRLMLAQGEEAKSLAQELYDLNQTRRAMTEDGIALAEEEMVTQGFREDPIIVLKLEDVHESLAGIIAGRIKEKYYRPTIVLTKTENGLKGSGRSIEEYNMFEGLHEVKDLMVKFGGHPMAAGMSLEESNLDIFRDSLHKGTSFTKDDLTPKVVIDARVNPAIITESFLNKLNTLEPFGKGNGKPVFAEKNLLISRVDLLGKDKNHVKLIFDIQGKFVEGLYFFATKTLLDLVDDGSNPTVSLENSLKGKKCDILFYPDLNTYNGFSKVQLKITDFRLSDLS